MAKYHFYSDGLSFPKCSDASLLILLQSKHSPQEDVARPIFSEIIKRYERLSLKELETVDSSHNWQGIAVPTILFELPNLLEFYLRGIDIYNLNTHQANKTLYFPPWKPPHYFFIGTTQRINAFGRTAPQGAQPNCLS